MIHALDRRSCISIGTENINLDQPPVELHIEARNNRSRSIIQSSDKIAKAQKRINGSYPVNQTHNTGYILQCRDIAARIVTNSIASLYCRGHCTGLRRKLLSDGELLPLHSFLSKYFLTVDLFSSYKKLRPTTGSKMPWLGSRSHQTPIIGPLELVTPGGTASRITFLAGTNVGGGIIDNDPEATKATVDNKLAVERWTDMWMRGPP
ncbi:hypothetical protein J6590_022313 [Homalodisca vitripennis]|nr:hypothetical protein J6590_022313 [Homalodisca vitripennis]